MVLAKLAPVALALLLNYADPFTFEYSGQTDSSGQAYLVIRANDEMRRLRISIEGDGQKITKELEGLKKGQEYRITWTQKSSKSRYELDIRGRGVEAAFAFEIAGGAKKIGRAGKLKVRSTRDDIVKRGTATYETNFDLTRYEYKIYDVDGDVVAADAVTDPVSAGGRFTITWDKNVDVFMVFVRGEDQYGRFTEYKLIPWSVEIPHTEINFDTGKSNIKNNEAPKIDEAVAVAFHELDALERVNKAVGANIKPRLYIVGYTDTVGSAGSNQKLSDGRARSIAQYFKDKGFWAAIYYAGMGERGLRVETGDNVDEVRNRRALYLIGIQQPAAGGQIPGRWKQLAGSRPRPAGFVLPPLPERWANYREKKDGKESDPSGDPGMGDQLPESNDPPQPATQAGGDDSSFYDDDGAAADGPPEVEGEPGATKKGCSIGGPPPAFGLWVLVALGVARRRRQT